MQQQTNLDLAVSHLNASVGSVLTAEQLAVALRAGSAHHAHHAPPSATAAALISSMFTELGPGLILRCAVEAGADVQHVNQLYEEALADAIPRAPAWEQSVEHFL